MLCREETEQDQWERVPPWEERRDIVPVEGGEQEPAKAGWAEDLPVRWENVYVRAVEKRLPTSRAFPVYAKCVRNAEAPW